MATAKKKTKKTTKALQVVVVVVETPFMMNHLLYCLELAGIAEGSGKITKEDYTRMEDQDSVYGWLDEILQTHPSFVDEGIEIPKVIKDIKNVGGVCSYSGIAEELKLPYYTAMIERSESAKQTNVVRFKEIEDVLSKQMAELNREVFINTVFNEKAVKRGEQLLKWWNSTQEKNGSVLSASSVIFSGESNEIYAGIVDVKGGVLEISPEIDTDPQEAAKMATNDLYWDDETISRVGCLFTTDGERAKYLVIFRNGVLQRNVQGGILVRDLTGKNINGALPSKPIRKPKK